ncbi:hypothetical protein [Streptomyces echinatus]|uniref:hypothetical protein n=1 Tax=Streptomyces echinatus TaxID=67293 RepID=UPI00380CB019
MSNGMMRPLLRTLPALVPAVVAPVAWAVWLGWDRQWDVRPDGTTTGPYQAWQVIGLVLTLLVAVCWAAARRHPASVVLGTTAGLTAAAWYDWSDDSTGLFAIGVGLVMVGGLAATAAVCGAVALVRGTRPAAGAER